MREGNASIEQLGMGYTPSYSTNPCIALGTRGIGEGPTAFPVPRAMQRAEHRERQKTFFVD